MFQNISEQEINKEEKVEDRKSKKINLKQIIKNMFTIPNIIIYIASYMISTVSILDGMAIFSMAIFAAACSNGMVAGAVYVATLAGTFVGMGKDAFLTYLLTSIFFMVLILMVKPHYQPDTKNEKILLRKTFNIFSNLYTSCKHFYWKIFNSRFSHNSYGINTYIYIL